MSYMHREDVDIKAILVLYTMLIASGIILYYFAFKNTMAAQIFASESRLKGVGNKLNN